MNKISINIIENIVYHSGITFKSNFKKVYEKTKPCDNFHQYDVTKEEETFQFLFFKDRTQTLKPKYFSVYQQPSNGATAPSSEELYYFIVYINLSLCNDDLTNPEKIWKYEDIIKPFIKEKSNKYKLLFVAVNYNYVIYDYNNGPNGKEFEENQLIRIKSFQEQLSAHRHIETKLIHIAPYSNKKYQNEYILNTVLSTFSNNLSDSSRKSDFSKFDGILELSHGNDLMVIQEVVNDFIENKSVIKPLELYIKLVPIEYTHIRQMLEESVQSLKKVLVESNYLLHEQDQKEYITFYNNFYSLYLVSMIENNLSLSNWLNSEIILLTEKKIHQNDPNFKLLSNIIMHGDKLSTRIAESGYSDIFKYQFELDEFKEKNNKQLYQNQQQQQHPISQFKTLGELFVSGSVFYIYSQKSFKNSFNVVKWFMEEKYESFCNQLNLYLQTTILLKSSYDNDLEVFKYVLNHKNSVVQVDSFLDNYNSIHFAALKGSLDILKYIHQEKDFNINSSKSLRYGVYPIHCAAEEHKQSTLDYLMESGANIESIDNEGATPLYYACKQYHYYHKYFKSQFQIEFCEYLIKKYKPKTTINLNGKKFNIGSKFLNKSCNIM